MRTQVLQHSQGRNRRLAAAVCATLLAGAFSILPTAQANPTGAVYDTNAVKIEGTTDMTITSNRENNVIKWNDFSIDKGEKVTFASEIANTKCNYLNYVTGSEQSKIFGALAANCGGGDIYIINPHGVLFGATAQIDVGAGNLFASTRTMSDTELMNWTTTPSLNPVAQASGDIVNQGATLKAMNITVEGDVITFTKAAIDGMTATGAATAAANELALGSDTGAATSNPFSGTAPTWYKMVNSADQISLTGNSMLGSDISVNDVLGNLTGKFNGAGYTANLAIAITGDGDLDPSLKKHLGLFGTIDGGTVRNLSLAGTIDKTGTYLGGNFCTGALAGIATNATITNVVNHAAIDSSKYDNVGGIVGKADGGTLRNISNFGNVSGNSYVGGIVGNAGEATAITINNAYNEGTIYGHLGGAYAGGIAGYFKGTMQYAYNKGNLPAESAATNLGLVGGIVGVLEDGTIRQACNEGTVTSTDNGGGEAIGGIVGWVQGTNNTIENAYNTGTIAIGGNGMYGGGIVGEARATASLTLTRVYNTGTIPVGDANTRGAIVGKNSGTVNYNGVKAFYLDTCGVPGIDDNEVPKTEAELKQLATFTAGNWTGIDSNLSSNATWYINNGVETPELRFRVANTTMIPSGGADYTSPPPTPTPDPDPQPDPVNPVELAQAGYRALTDAIGAATAGAESTGSDTADEGGAMRDKHSGMLMNSTHNVRRVVLDEASLREMLGADSDMGFSTKTTGETETEERRLSGYFDGEDTGRKDS